MKGGERNGGNWPGRDEVTAAGLADRVYARSAAHRRLVDRTLTEIEAALEGRGPVAVSFSGGKDSTVALDLIRRVRPDARAVFFDSGLEHQETYEIVKRLGVDTMAPERPLLEVLKAGGYWGYRGPDADLSYNYDHIEMYYERPTSLYVAEHGIEVTVLGLRKDESAGRSIGIRRRGHFYQHQRSGTWRLLPLARWTHDDVWAYIADRQLPYNAVYDRMARFGVPRVQWRVSCLIDIGGARLGRFSWFRQMFPDIYARLAADFPILARYT